ncbi:hypothetical protein IWQ60_001340 [Tieghemiomyces parasiticus]|uniref:SRP9 domain-containing protein n=1 Tax=Tieghemiomyces parasiticus TaxID=78921 RepID=A0A9W8AEC6_9FUNG|nr:hypothetical protein IWQ60_001340 [Tieghemiomyces parasiticus]
MTLLNTLDEFQREAEALYVATPYDVRFVTKFEPSAGVIKFKLTNDITTIQYWAREAGEAQRIENLNKDLAARLHNVPVTASPIEVESVHPEPIPIADPSRKTESQTKASGVSAQTKPKAKGKSGAGGKKGGKKR